MWHGSRGFLMASGRTSLFSPTLSNIEGQTRPSQRTLTAKPSFCQLNCKKVTVCSSLSWAHCSWMQVPFTHGLAVLQDPLCLTRDGEDFSSSASFSHDQHSICSALCTSMNRNCHSPRSNKDSSDTAEGLRGSAVSVHTETCLLLAWPNKRPSVRDSGHEQILGQKQLFLWQQREVQLRGRCHLVNASWWAQACPKGWSLSSV